MEDNTIKISHILFMILMMGIIIVVGTYAWLSYRSNDTAMVLTIGEINNVQVTLSPYQIKASLLPQVTYTSDNYTSVTAINNSNSPRKINLYYRINSIDTELISSDFKYTIERSTDGNNYSEYKSGNFNGTSNGSELTILEESISSNTTYQYKVYLWIDGSNSGQSYMQGKSFNGELRAEINSIFLPIQYQQIEYLESTGAQYINTNLPITTDSKLTLDFKANSNISTKYIMGKYQSDDGSFYLYFSGNRFQTAYGCKYANTAKESDTDRHYWEFYIENSNSIAKCDNEVVFTRSVLATMPNSNILIGGTYHSGSAVGNNIYGAKFYKNNSLIRDFIPAYRKSDGVAGMYDIINNTFYTNAGSGTFGIGPKVLPSEYQFVEYLESTGAQYINTNLSIALDLKLDLDFKANSNTSGKYIMGKYQSNDGSFYLYFGGGYFQTAYGSTYANTTKQSDIDRHYWEFYIENDNSIAKCDNEVVFTRSVLATMPNSNILIGGTYHSGSTVGSNTYGAKFYRNNSLIRDFIPAYRKSDNVAGLYDTITNEFYTNAGSGTFGIGPEI